MSKKQENSEDSRPNEWHNRKIETTENLEQKAKK